MPMIAHLVNGDAGPLSKMAETASPNWATASATLGSSNYCSGFITLTSVCAPFLPVFKTTRMMLAMLPLSDFSLVPNLLSKYRNNELNYHLTKLMKVMDFTTL